MRSLEEIYASLPAIDCKGLCARSCGPILVPEAELAAMTAAAEKPIPVSPSKYEYGFRLTKTDRKRRCPLLYLGRCTIYEARPLICRLWGVTPEMPCMYGCVPDRWVEKAEANALLGEILDLSGSDPAAVP